MVEWESARAANGRSTRDAGADDAHKTADTFLLKVA
jgi:hypothetical protein